MLNSIIIRRLTNVAMCLALASCGHSEAQGGSAPAAAQAPTPPSGAAPTQAAPTQAAPTGQPLPAHAATTPTHLTPTPGSVRVVALHDGELLGSEQRDIRRFVARVGRGRTAELAEPDAAEQTAAAAWLDASDRPLPNAWAQNEVVVILRLAAPTQSRSGRRVTRGLRDMLVLKPGAEEASYRETVNMDSEMTGPPRPRFNGAQWGAAIDDLLDDMMEAQ